jgi:hypothetical protein
MVSEEEKIVVEVCKRRGEAWDRIEVGLNSKAGEGIRIIIAKKKVREETYEL